MRSLNSRVSMSIIFIILFMSAMAGVALASIPDASGVIHSCRANATGALRVIASPSQACTVAETSLSWNQAGPVGPTGPQGPQGPAGVRPIAFAGKMDAVGETANRYAALTEYKAISDSSSRTGRDLTSPPFAVGVSKFGVKLITRDTDTDTTAGSGNTRSFKLMVGNTAYSLCSISDSNGSCSVSNPGISIPAFSNIVLKSENSGGLGTSITNALFYVELTE